jgi:hypothetical protein
MEDLALGSDPIEPVAVLHFCHGEINAQGAVF